MQATLIDFGKDSVEYNFSDITFEELENKINLFFANENLTLNSDEGDKKVYQKGNKWLRIFFGVFVNYFKVVVTISQSSGLFSVKIKRDMNFFMSGGLMGLQKSRNEFNRISDAFKVYFN